jgi:hypothetical protein
MSASHDETAPSERTRQKADSRQPVEGNEYHFPPKVFLTWTRILRRVNTSGQKAGPVPIREALIPAQLIALRWPLEAGGIF